MTTGQVKINVTLCGFSLAGERETFFWHMAGSLGSSVRGV